MPRDYLENADVWTILNLIVAEFESDPMSLQCFDSRVVDRAIRLNRDHFRADAAPASGDGSIGGIEQAATERATKSRSLLQEKV